MSSTVLSTSNELTHSGHTESVGSRYCCLPHFTDKELRLREVRLLAQGHTASKRQSQIHT